MNLLKQWLATAFPTRRVMPAESDVRGFQALYTQVFSNPAGRELIELWVEQIMFTNPRTTDPNECIRFAAQCAFVEDIVKAIDRAENPAKYQPVRRVA